MTETEQNAALRQAAFQHVRRLTETHDQLSPANLKPGFLFRGERIPLINPQHGIFKPRQMRFLHFDKDCFSEIWGTRLVR